MTGVAGPRPSPDLAAFLREAPYDRSAIHQHVAAFAADLLPGTRVLDAGAGRQPFRELFAHCEYVASDWANSPHAEVAAVDIVAPLDSLPLEDAVFDAVVCTQVLEHVASPRTVLAELARIARANAPILVTVPLVGGLHEEPYDFFRYTSFGVESLLAGAGFDRISVVPMTSYYSTLAQILRDAALYTGVREQGDYVRRAITGSLRVLAGGLPLLDRFDSRRALPLGFAATGARSDVTTV